MKKITETLSKEVVAAAEGEIVGIVTNAYVDRRLSRVRGYKVSSDDRDAGRMLPLRRLLGEGEAMMVKSAATLTETPLADCPIGAKVFDTMGAFLGILRDLVYDETNGVVLSLIADEKEIATDRIVSSGKTAVILRAPRHDGVLFRTGSRPKARKRFAPNAQLTIEQLLSETPQTAETRLPEVRESESAPSDPVFSGEYAFLLGRTVLKDIFAGGEMIAAEGAKVTPDLLNAAREKGKLVELTVNSRRG